jgi:16S rRNA (guanine966-N2)-methyltransferase
MRVVAGRLGGREFAAPRGRRTHPMSDKARGALFNALGDIGGLTVLDAFAGSGALSFEALSRGAADATMIEIDRSAAEVIERNIGDLGLAGQAKVIRANCSSWSDQNPNAHFDIVLAAPPYDDLKPQLLAKLTRHVKPGGLYVLDWPGSLKIPEFEDLEQLKYKNYGDAALVFYRKTD